MRMPGIASLLYLGYVCVLLPWAAIRSKHALEPATASPTPRPPITRTSMYVSTLISLILLFIVSWVTGRTFGFDAFEIPRFGVRELAAGAVALVAQFGFMLVARWIHSPEERRKMLVYRIIPRNRKDWSLWVPVCAAAGLAEETAYRGVLVAILSYSVGSFWAACLISAAVFAVSHALQGWKSGIVIFAMALSMHALAAYTGTLVIGMVVHALYDLVAVIVTTSRMKADGIEFEPDREPPFPREALEANA